MKEEGEMACYAPEDNEDHKLPMSDLIGLWSVILFIVFGIPLLIHWYKG